MIPLKLTLKNFLCYRDNVPPLDLTGIHVACLCGPNGHGKSALLDSITWALWGRARGRSRDELLSFGQTDMQVDLEFLARDTHYRVVRRHRLRGAGNLELQISGPSGFHPITGNSMRQTQFTISRIIGMDYETFINSAFLIQGRADEFTNKTPAERKDVLGKIIGLDQYNELQDRSRTKAQEKRRIGDDIEATFQFMRKELDRKEEFLRDLLRINEEIEAVSQWLSAKTRQVDELLLQVRDLEQKIERAKEIESRTPSIEREIADYHRQSQRSAALIEKYRGLVKERSAIEAGLREYEEAQRENEDLNAARAQHDALNSQASALLQTVAQAKARLEERSQTLRRRLEREVEPKSKRATSLKEELAKAARKITDLEREETALGQERIRLQDLAAQVGQLEAMQGPLRSEGEELRKKLDLLSSSHRRARCPLCDTSLGEEDCQRLAHSYGLQIEEKRDQYRNNQKDLTVTKDLQKQLSAQVPKSEAALRRGQQQAQRHTATLERDLEESHRAAEEAKQMSVGLKTLEQDLDEAQYAPAEQAALKEIKGKLDQLQYAPERHRKLTQRLQDLQVYQLRGQQLGEAIQRLPQEEDALAAAKDGAARRGGELLEMKAELSTLQAEIPQLPAKKSQLATAQVEQNYEMARHQELLTNQGNLQGSLQRIEGLERQMAQQTKELRALREEQSTYEELSQAFGRQGVQALLIDTILPQIEDGANELLDRMTDGRMNVKLESQREIKSRRGEYAETLEIRVSDEVGPRSYEMFSGGEAFRINLALRIALSKVLANRSGAPLPTLFIDEGFGTQDTAGRERILDVLRSIESDFKCIIVITHLEELKDAFPVRIEVEKRDGSSTCWIS